MDQKKKIVIKKFHRVLFSYSAREISIDLEDRFQQSNGFNDFQHNLIMIPILDSLVPISFLLDLNLQH